MEQAQAHCDRALANAVDASYSEHHLPDVDSRITLPEENLGITESHPSDGIIHSVKSGGQANIDYHLKVQEHFYSVPY
jgi:hypothetical protein